MTTLYRMPSLGADMEVGTLIEWVLQPGQTFTKGDVIAVVETQKGAIEVEVFHDGVMGRQLIEVGQTVPVGTPLAKLEAATVTAPDQKPEVQSGAQLEVLSGSLPADLAVSATGMTEAAPLAAPSPQVPPSEAASPEVSAAEGSSPVASPPEAQFPRMSSPEAPSPRESRPPSAPLIPLSPPTPEPIAPQAPHRLRASPAARRLAQQRGLSLDGLVGTGPGRAIVLADVRSAAVALPSGTAQAVPSGPVLSPTVPPMLAPSPTVPPMAAPPPTTSGRRPAHPGLDLAAMRQAIAAAMAHAKREIPHYYLSQDIDLTPASDWLARRNAELPPEQRLLMGVLFIKAVALTLKGFPELNGFDREGRFEPSAAIHVGCATAIRGGGLVAPAIHDTDHLDLDTLMAKLRDLVARVRSGGLRASELADPTITVSSLGERGVDRLYGIIYPPQVAIVGFGTPRPAPWVLEDRVVPRQVVTVTLAADHRHSDGHRGALFLAQVAQRLHEPENL